MADVMKERDLKKTATNQTIGKILVKVMVYAFLILMAIIVIFPFYWMINSSLKTLDEYRAQVPTFWPRAVMFSKRA